MKDAPINKLRQTITQPEAIRVLDAEFTNYIPRRLEEAIDKYPGDWRMNRKEWTLADNLDCIDYHYRRYLRGHCKTLHRVFYEFKRLDKNNFFNGIHVIQTAADICLVNEFYELLHKHQSAKTKILRLGLKLHGQQP